MAGNRRSPSRVLRRRIAGLLGAVVEKGGTGMDFPLSASERGSGGEVSSPRRRMGQGVRALLLALVMCLAGNAWGRICRLGATSFRDRMVLVVLVLCVAAPQPILNHRESTRRDGYG